MKDLLCQMFYTLYGSGKNACYNITVIVCSQTFMFIGDIVLLLYLVGIKIPIPADFDRLIKYNDLFWVSMIFLAVILMIISFYALFRRNRRLARMLLYARRKYGRKCKWSMLWLAFSPFLLMGLLFFVVCAKNNGYF